METQCVFREVETKYLHTVHNKRMVRVTAAVSFFCGTVNSNYSMMAVRDEYGDTVGWCHSSF